MLLLAYFKILLGMILGLHVFPRQLAHVVSGPLIPSNKKKEDLAHLDLPTKASSKKKSDLAQNHTKQNFKVCKQQKKET